MPEVARRPLARLQKLHSECGNSAPTSVERGRREMGEGEGRLSPALQRQYSAVGASKGRPRKGVRAGDLGRVGSTALRQATLAAQVRHG